VNPAYLSPVANHLWQSTLFAGVAGLLTLVLGKNRARVRHWVWVAASWKFLIPFSLLITLGGHIQWRTVYEVRRANISILVDEVSRPFGVPVASPSSAAPLPRPLTRLFPSVVCSIWACGFLGLSVSWWVRWRRIRVAIRSALPVDLDIPVRTVSSPTLLEPGVFGIFRPVLLFPEGVSDRLTPEQLKGIITHELCHIRHHDNLSAAIHMFVETICWFHPLVWWIGKQMVWERERACDEEVLRLGNEPQVYAEGILNVCKLYVESPLACMSGVTGSNLKRRIEAIMSNRSAVRLNFAKRVALSVAGVSALAAPLVVGMMNAPLIRAQSSPTPAPKFEVASVKSSNPSNRGISISGDPSRFTIRNVPIRFLISLAYNVKDFQIHGGPRALDSERYDIDATYGANPPERRGRLTFMTIQADPQVRLMLQALLVDRFHLAIRRETKELPAYSLNLAKNGPKLRESTTPEDLQDMRVDLGQVESNRMSTEQLAGVLSRLLGLPIVDKTGLTGYYDLLLKWTPDEASADAVPGPSLFTAIQDTLGLKLVSGKQPVDVLVIDHVEKPTEN